MVIQQTRLPELLGTYNFYKSPDGSDGLQKTYYLTKYGAIGGAIISVYDMALFSKPTTVYQTLARIGRFTFPFAGMGFVFGASTCVLGQLRKKDDVANHVIGGGAAGFVMGIKYRSVYIGHVWGILLAATAGIYKYYKVNNLDPFPRRGNETDKHDARLDFTIKMYDDPGRPNSY